MSPPAAPRRGEPRGLDFIGGPRPGGDPNAFEGRLQPGPFLCRAGSRRGQKHRPARERSAPLSNHRTIPTCQKSLWGPTFCPSEERGGARAPRCPSVRPPHPLRPPGPASGSSGDMAGGRGPGKPAQRGLQQHSKLPGSRDILSLNPHGPLRACVRVPPPE